MKFKKPNRDVTRVFLHCTGVDNDNKYYVGPEIVRTIRAGHQSLGYSDIGYHYIIDKLGQCHVGRSLEQTPAAQAPHNSKTIAICVHGFSNFTDVSLDRLKRLCKEINEAYDGQITFHGHCEVSPKPCPVYDYKTLLNLDTSGKMPLTVNTVDKNPAILQNKPKLGFLAWLINLLKGSK